MDKKYLLLLCFCYLQIAARPVVTNILDSLRHKDYDYLFDRIESPELSAARRGIYLSAFLEKAREEKNWEELSNAYKNYVHYAPDKLKLVYADSMVLVAKYTKDEALIGSAYLSKGIAYYGRKRLVDAMNFYLIANDHISRTDNKYLIYKVKYNIAHIKYFLGYYDESVTLFKECISYMRKKEPRGYLNSLHSLGLCYNRMGNYGLCSNVNEQGIRECRSLNEPDMIAYFTHSEGINQCMLHNYRLAIEKLKGALPGVRKNHDFANEAVADFYIGKSYWEMDRKELAVPYLKKVDKAFREKGYIRPDLREGYELLITYSKNKGDTKAQLYYIERLLKADRMLHQTYRYLIGKVTKDYDTRELNIEKRTIEKALQQRRYNDYIFTTVISLLIAGIVIIVIHFMSIKKALRKRYQLLLAELDAKKEKQSRKTESNPELAISGDAVANVLAQLEKFEQGKKFLEKDMNLMRLALFFGTNTNYLSKIIAHHRQKNFPEYINDLRIDHIAERIKNDRLLQKYTNAALAEEAGFTTTRRFTNAFVAKTGITPTFFMEELAREKRKVKDGIAL